MDLNCGSCGMIFRGQQTASHDIGYGTCKSCEDTQVDRANEILDEAINTIKANLKPNKLDIFNNWPLEKQRDFAEQMIAKGIVTYSF